jgi:hypothetical protein
MTLSARVQTGGPTRRQKPPGEEVETPRQGHPIWRALPVWRTGSDLGSVETLAGVYGFDSHALRYTNLPDMVTRLPEG